MALGNAKQNTRVARSLYTGVNNLKPILINPSEQEIEIELGYKPEKTRQYTNLELAGKNFSKVVIFLRGQGLDGENYISTVEFLVSDRIRKSEAKGKTCFINNAGLTSWAVDKDGLQEWFVNKGGVRPCYEGEEELLEFFIKLGRLDTYAEKPEIYFEDFLKIAKGNVAELKALINDNENFNQRSIKCLHYVQKEKYNKIWNKAFDIQEAVIPKSIKSALEESPMKDGDDWGGSFEFKKYTQAAAPEQKEE